MISGPFFLILLHNHIINKKKTFSGDVHYEAIFPFFFLLHKGAKPMLCSLLVRIKSIQICYQLLQTRPTGEKRFQLLQPTYPPMTYTSPITGAARGASAAAGLVVERGGERRSCCLLGPGRLRLSQGASLKPDKSERCSPLSGGTIQLCSSWPSDDPPTPLRSSVDTGAGDRGGAPAEFAVVAETVGCRKGVGSVERGVLCKVEKELADGCRGDNTAC